MVEVVPNQTFEDDDRPSMCSELAFFSGFYSLKVLADADYFANLLRLHRPFLGKKRKKNTSQIRKVWNLFVFRALLKNKKRGRQ